MLTNCPDKSFKIILSFFSGSKSFLMQTTVVVSMMLWKQEEEPLWEMESMEKFHQILQGSLPTSQILFPFELSKYDNFLNLLFLQSKKSHKRIKTHL